MLFHSRIVSVFFSLFVVCFAVSAKGEEKQFQFPKTGVTSQDEATLLAIDEVSLSFRRNLCLYLSRPMVRKEPVLAPRENDPNAPDHVAAHFYGTVLHEKGKYRMWYYPVSHRDHFEKIIQGPVCYAESEDGIEWDRPNLGQVEYLGSTNNNCIDLPGDNIEGVNVIRDDEDPDPQRRYKMVFNAFNGRTYSIRSATSPDGIHWKDSGKFLRDQFLEQSALFKHNGFYFIHGQQLEKGEGGKPRGRQGYAWISPDFDHWVNGSADAFVLPEPPDAKDRGTTMPYDQVHLGVTGVSLGNVVVGLYGLWHNQPGDTSRKVIASWFGHEKTSCDLGLVVSHDGIHFKEPVRNHVYISRKESAVEPYEGREIPTVLIQSTGILNVGDETRIYHGRWRNAVFGKGYRGEVALATLPRDRWGALGLYPEENEGEVWSLPFKVSSPQTKIILNADSAEEIEVEICDSRFKPIEGFSGKLAGKTGKPNRLEVPVQFSQADFSELAGKSIRLKIKLKRNHNEPRLYAIYLR